MPRKSHITAMQKPICKTLFATTLLASSIQLVMAQPLSVFTGQALSVSGISAEQSTELVVIDSRVPDAATLIDAMLPGTEVIFVDSNSNGVAQLANYLKHRNNISTLHIISHGDKGVLLLGNEPLYAGNIHQHSNQLRAIGAALTENGDIKLYGCDVAKGAEGAAFLTQFSQLTAADIAASNDLTGSSAKGENWDLEISIGSIEHSRALLTNQLDSERNTNPTFPS